MTHYLSGLWGRRLRPSAVLILASTTSRCLTLYACSFALFGGYLAAPRSSSTRSSTAFFSSSSTIFFSRFLCLALCVTPSQSSSCPIGLGGVLLAQLSRHRGGPVPALFVFRRVERRSLSGSSPCFRFASPAVCALRTRRPQRVLRPAARGPSPPRRALRLRQLLLLHRALGPS